MDLGLLLIWDSQTLVPYPLISDSDIFGDNLGLAGITSASRPGHVAPRLTRRRHLATCCAKGHMSVITKVASARELGYDWGRSLREHPRSPDSLKMAGDSSHGGGFPGAGDDFDPMTLPPRVRPFIPGRYTPPMHVLPRAVFCHFTHFDERAPGDLLLREPEQHLPYEAREVGSRSVRGYGSTAARDWYAELPEAVRDLVDLVGFGPFCAGLSRCPARRILMAALVERWWDTTNSFHFSATGDMTMTPLDFAVLTGLDTRGGSIPYDEDMGEWEAAWTYLLGARPPVDRASGRVRYTWFYSHFRRAEMVPETPEEVAQYARGFLMFLFGTTLFADRGNTVGLYLLSALVDLSQVSGYDWGGAGLATLYFYMTATSRGQGDLLGGYWRAWELWVYAYFPALGPELEVAGPLVTPYSLVFEGPHRPRRRESLLYLRQYFDTVRQSEITRQPWAPLGDALRFQYPGGVSTSQYRTLLEGPVGRAWFLGERFLRQVWGYLSQDPPAAPPVSMRTADRFSFQEIVGATLGSDALLHLEEGDYATYRHIYLMPPLTGARTPMTRPAGMSSSGQARARAADAPSTSGAGTSRGGGRPVPPTYPHPGWPDVPTELMGWQYGSTSPVPIPLEPPMPGHRYVIDPDSPPVRSTALHSPFRCLDTPSFADDLSSCLQPPREYTEEMVGLVATLEGMVLRREAQMSIMGVQSQARPPGPPWGAGPSGPFHGAGPSRAFQGAGPSRPFRGAGPSRPFRGARGGPVRRRRARVVEEEPDEEEEEEATDRQSDTSAEEGGSGLGFGSGDEAEGDPEDGSSDSDDDGAGDGDGEPVPQKRTKRASHYCS
ncbi:hypothetical protein HYC85_029322 [Camellia sinensis]|uniref:Aminotransferase-like plant mobile domain-containing protein n=1 Tax=Camellia sinensis TaxID=4442 RepID=A0A7J7FYX3_CAMSI|nr:hypothetical protein HYC85_029322 [Camellia sinensis]